MSQAQMRDTYYQINGNGKDLPLPPTFLSKLQGRKASRSGSCAEAIQKAKQMLIQNKIPGANSKSQVSCTYGNGTLDLDIISKTPSNPMQQQMPGGKRRMHKKSKTHRRSKNKRRSMTKRRTRK